MKKRLFFLTLVLMGFFGLSAFTISDDPFADLLKKLEEFAKRYPQEKVHLHLDKPYYAIGDDIWFKAYVVDSRTNAPSGISNVLYVELINEQNQLVQQAMLPMKEGISWGDFRLGEGLTEGNYRIRAYTQWMRNAGPDFFFDRTIKIANSAPDRVVTKTTYGTGQQPKSTIRFTDQSGKPFTANAVSYQVVQDNGTNTNGKATTDADGNISIAIGPGGNGMAKVVATITLANRQKVTKVIPIRTSAANVDVQFFPEGGSLVQDLPNRIGIKAVNTEGRGEDVSGTIMDGDGTEVTTFNTTYLGMGSFSLNPMAGKIYKAKIQFRDGTSRLMDLPAATASGYILNINNTDSTKMLVKVLRSGDLLAKGELQLVGQQNGNVCLVAKVPAKVLVNLSVPKQTLPSGVVTFTLFTSEGIPVAERIAFVYNDAAQLKVEATNLKASYGKREDMKLGLSVSGMDARGSFSVAITNESVISPDPDNESNILTSLLLSSELKGYIERPNHYFLDNDAKTRAELDNLMLTQGWRRIDWVALVKDQFPAVPFEAQKSLKISGTLTDKKGVPVVDGKVSIFSATNGVFSNAVKADAQGNFVFDEMDFNDSTKFNLQGSNAKKEKSLKLKIDMVPDQAITANRNMGDFETDINMALKDYLDKGESYFQDLGKRGLLSRTIMLKQIEVKAEVPKKQVPEYSSNFNGPGNADAIITADELSTSVNFSQALAKVMGVYVVNGKARVRLLGGSMAIVLDGLMLNSNNLDLINIADIETIEVLSKSHNLVVYGVAGGNGVLVITTKRGPDKRRPVILSEPDSKISYTPKGYQVAREFYVPKHSEAADPRPDLRPLVYWNPYLVMGADGKLNLNFSNSDQTGTYRIVIEGMDEKGNLARAVFKYQVN
jgi:hypothetical protein